MGFGKRLQASVNYGAKVLNSGLEGARAGREAFLHEGSLTPFLEESVRHAWKPAAMGACIGVLSSYSGNGRKSIPKAFAYGFLGGAIGFGAGVAWGSRRLVASVAVGARKNMGRVRDEHWLEEHPIDYA
jgi:hypothetical protein